MPQLNLVDQYTYADIMAAYLDCRRRKRGTRTCIAYEVDFERNLSELLDEVNSGEYQIGRTRVFAVSWPKHREIWAAQFRDRIVHHLVCNSVSPWYESYFCQDSFSCIKGRGTLAAGLRLEKFCRQATENWYKDAWCLQIDIANFFVSINREILWEVLRERIGETSLTAQLIRQIVFHDPTANPIVKDGSDFSGIPAHKSLWHCPKGNGLPIGNLTSQFFSNIYLDGLDKYIKHTLRARWYVRYVDDAVLLSHDRDQLYAWRDAIDTWLRVNRKLHLHPNKVKIQPAKQGIDFVGRYILPFRSYPRKMTVHSAKKALADLRKRPMDRGSFDRCQSYLGIMRHTNSFNTRKRLCEAARIPLTIGHNASMTKITNLQ